MTLTELKEKIAEEEGYSTWGHFLRTATEDDAQYCIDKASKLYAIEKVKEALFEAANHADYYICQNDDGQEPFHHESNIRIDRNSILSLETELIENIKNEK